MNGQDAPYERPDSVPEPEPDCSVLVFTYNHARYIEKCLDSCLDQDTDYSYEILIGEDDSKDGTREICQRYADRFPGKIRLFLNDRKNVIEINGRPTGRWNIMNLIAHARGRYYAIVAGDDYWTSKEKIQRQVSFLDTHPEYTMCHTSGSKVTDEEPPVITSFPHRAKQSYSIEDILEKNDIITSSVMYRNGVVTEFPDWLYYTAPMLDWPLHLLHAMKGKLWRIDENMTAYLVHSGGIWSGLGQWTRSLEYLEFCEFLRSSVLDPKYHHWLETNIYHLHYRIAYSSYKYDRILFREHFMYCLSNAGINATRIRQVLVLIMIMAGLVQYDRERLRISIGRRSEGIS